MRHGVICLGIGIATLSQFTTNVTNHSLARLRRDGLTGYLFHDNRGALERAGFGTGEGNPTAQSTATTRGHLAPALSLMGFDPTARGLKSRRAPLLNLPLSVSVQPALMFKERPIRLPLGQSPRYRPFDLGLFARQSDRASVSGKNAGCGVELFLMHDRIAYQGITFDDILLEPGYSELLPHQVDTRSQLTSKIGLNIPILSSPMDTVTEAELAIALAQEGGLGLIHKNMSVEEQTREVDKVKRSENGIIVDPITLPPDATVGQARQIMTGQNISGVPITVNGFLRGILTRRDLRFLESNDLRIVEVMTKNAQP